MDYTVSMFDGTFTHITKAASVNQKFGFLEFRTLDGSLIIAIRVDAIKDYAPASACLITPTVTKQFRVTKSNRSK